MYWVGTDASDCHLKCYQQAASSRKLLSGMLNVFSIAVDIVTVGLNEQGGNYDATFNKEMQTGKLEM